MKNADLKQIQQAIIDKDNPATANGVSYNQFWQTMHGQYDVGKPLGKVLILADTDYSFLQDLYDSHSKVPIEAKVLTHTNRLAISAQRKDEKDSQWSVFGELLAFVSNATMPLIDKPKVVNVPILSGTVLTARLEAIAIANLKKIIVLENGSMLSYFDEWQDKLPPDWQDAVCVYRGHGDNQNLVKQLLAQVASDCQIAFFMDFDVFGISLIEPYLSICYHNTVELLLPPNWQSMTQYHADNQHDLFIKQSQRLPTVSQPMLKELQHFLVNHQLAITQENVYHWQGLSVLKLGRVDNS